MTYFVRSTGSRRVPPLPRFRRHMRQRVALGNAFRSSVRRTRGEKNELRTRSTSNVGLNVAAGAASTLRQYKGLDRVASLVTRHLEYPMSHRVLLLAGRGSI